MRWQKATSSDAMGKYGPGKRWGHTLNAMGGGRFLYLFGGYGRANCQTNQVDVYDTVTQQWNQTPLLGNPPVPRDSHTCTTVGNRLFIFGGTDGMNPLNDLHILDIASSAWLVPVTRGEVPEPREGHTATLIGKTIFIFGGCGKSKFTANEVYYNDLFTFNTDTCVWNRVATSGIPPSARDSHTCLSWGRQLIVIGGEDGHEYYLNDVHIFDTDKLVWRELNVSGDLLPPRAGHSAVAFDKYLFVFGGFSDEQNLYDDLHMLDVDTATWTKIQTTGDGPSARFSMAADCMDPTISGALVFIGGCDRNLEALDDMYFLHTDLVKEFGRDEKRMEKLSLRKQLKMKCYPASSNNKTLVPFESGTYSQQGPQHLHLNDYQPTIGSRTFYAKVTSQLLNGYTIESVVDGKPLRGIVFSDKPYIQTSVRTASRNLSGETESVKDQVKLNGDREPKTDFSVPKDHKADTGSAAKELGSPAPNKSVEVVAGTSVPEKDPNVNQQDHKENEGTKSETSEKKSARLGETIIPTSQGEKDGAESTGEQGMVPSSETH